MAYHHLSKQEQSVSLMRYFKIVDLLSGEYSSMSPAMVNLHKKCVAPEVAARCKKFLGLKFSPQDSPISIYSRLVSRLGLSLINRRGTSGQRERYYHVSEHELLSLKIDIFGDFNEQMEIDFLTSNLPQIKMPTDLEKIDADIANLISKRQKLRDRDLFYQDTLVRLEAFRKTIIDRDCSIDLLLQQER